MVGIKTTGKMPHFVHIIYVIHTFSPHELRDSMDHNVGLSVSLSTTLVQTEMSTTVGWVAMIFCTVMSPCLIKEGCLITFALPLWVPPLILQRRYSLLIVSKKHFVLLLFINFSCFNSLFFFVTRFLHKTLQAKTCWTKSR